MPARAPRGGAEAHARDRRRRQREPRRFGGCDRCGLSGRGPGPQRRERRLQRRQQPGRPARDRPVPVSAQLRHRGPPRRARSARRLAARAPGVRDGGATARQPRRLGAARLHGVPGAGHGAVLRHVARPIPARQVGRRPLPHARLRPPAQPGRGPAAGCLLRPRPPGVSGRGRARRGALAVLQRRRHLSPALEARIRYVAEAEVMHHCGASTKSFQDFVVIWHRNRIVYYRKHYGAWIGPLLHLVVRMRAAEEWWRAGRRNSDPGTRRAERAFLKQAVRQIFAPGGSTR